MARIRTIKPEFWANEKLSVLPEATHMLAAALLNYADDEGYFNANHALIRAACFPLREPSVSVPDSLIALSNAGYLKLGSGEDGRRYGQVLKFSEHQRINRPTASKIKDIEVAWDDSLKTHSQLSEPSPPERNREQGKEQGREGNRDTSGEPTVHRGTSDVAELREKAESIERVFEHWRTSHNHPKASLDPKRTKLIRDRLKQYTEADLCQSITGYLNSPHHMGENDKGTPYDDLELFLRDAKHVDAGLKFYANPPRTDLSAATRKMIRQTKDWVPPELRDATRN
jgi:hypothetical protein